MTVDAASLTLFSRLITLGSGSLLQYVSESSPWSADPAHTAMNQVLALAHEERAEVIRLTRLLQKKHLDQPITGYPSHFTNINFCSLDYLLPKLVAENEKEIAEVEALLRLSEDEEVRSLAKSYLDMKRRHLQSLKQLAAFTSSAGAA